MKYTWFFFAFIFCVVVHAQILSPYQPTITQPRVQFDYWMYSTHAGTGLTNQYPVNITSRAQMDNLFDISNSNTTLVQSGKTNDARMLDWTSTSTLSSMGITIPNSGNYFALKIQGTFIPLESGTYTFSVEGDDAIDFAIDGQYVTSRYTSLAVQPLGSTTGSISLTTGKRYTFIIRMQNGNGGAGLRMYWRAPSQGGSIASGYTTNWAQNVQEITSTPNMDGSTASRAAPNAQYIKNLTGTNTDGVYWINLPNVGPTQIFCLMNSQVDGGGWMMMMKATTGNTFEYDSSHWTSISTLNPTQNNRNNGDAKFDTMNYFAGKDLLALWPDITTAGGSLSLTNYGCWSWLQNNFNNNVRITPINFFNSVNRLFLGDTNNFTGRGTQFSTQADVRFYGFNYNNLPISSVYTYSKSRWGFGWNENGGGLFPNGNEQSPDVAGGIGLSFGGSVRYSAGDYIGCCQINSGINRSARVEIYIR